jgi:hypothetical protein
MAAKNKVRGSVSDLEQATTSVNERILKVPYVRTVRTVRRGTTILLPHFRLLLFLLPPICTYSRYLYGYAHAKSTTVPTGPVYPQNFFVKIVLPVIYIHVVL